MSYLNVVLIDKDTDTVINDKYPYILLDDSINIIKEKLFAHNPKYIPNYLKMELLDNVNETNLKLITSNSLVFENYTNTEIELTIQPKIYITNLNEIIKSGQYIISYNTLFKDDILFSSEFNNLKKEYYDLTEDDFHLAINYMMLKDGYPKDKLDMYDRETHWLNLYNNYRKKYIDEDNNITLQKFYELSTHVSSSNEINLLDNKVTYNDIHYIINDEMYTQENKKRFIKLNEIFNVFELSENIPFIALDKKQNSNVLSSKIKTPLIKIYNKLIEKTTEKEIKNWVLNEKLKLNQASYKKINGLMMKSKINIGKNNYLTINILANGIISAEISLLENTTLTLNEITQMVKENINNIIVNLNKLNGVFLYSQRLIILDLQSQIKINLLNTIIETNIFINRRKFGNLLKKNIISNNILELKKTDSSTVLSALYTKISNIEDKKGITINIIDNMYKENSSIIKLLGSKNLLQNNIILQIILILNDMAETIKSNGYFEELDNRMIKSITIKKILKNQGINFAAKDCQGNRQPIIDNENKHDLLNESYSINFKDNVYKCKNESHPYPGFTNNNIICCFKQTQNLKEKFINNFDPESQNIYVEPSNFKISIGEPKFETFVIKIISDYKDGFNEKNSISRYYYVQNKPSPQLTFYDFSKNSVKNKQEILIPIINENLIKAIEQEDNIWLKSVPLSTIIYPSALSQCTSKPDLNNKSENINSPCDIYKKNKFFGYNSNSVPCCFDKPREQYINKKSKESDITKQYIIASDKILNYQQIGVLPKDISTLFNDIINFPTNEPNSMYYRMGIIQDDNSLYNAILLGINNKINYEKINNHLEFKNLIINYIQTKQYFYKINNGNIALKYSNINNYINFVNSSNSNVNWIDVIDVLERITLHNIIVIDIEKESKILCRKIDPALQFKHKDRPFIIILKNKGVYELLIKLIQHSTKKDIIHKKNEIIKQFFWESSKYSIVKFLLEYYKDSCIKEDIFPENYIYLPLLNSKELIVADNIKYQILNEFNKINYLVDKYGFIIPIVETGIIENKDLKIISLQKLLSQFTESFNFKNYTLNLKRFNKQQGHSKIEILGVIHSNSDNIGGILTNMGAVVPYLKDDTDIDAVKLDFKYYFDIDNVLSDENVKIDSPYNQFNQFNEQLKTNIFEIKKKISKKLENNKDSETIKIYLQNIIKKNNLSKSDKINKIITILNKLKIKSDNIDQSTLLFIYNIIANEILNDNKENLLLNNIVISDNINKNDINLHDTESILLNINDIINWINKYKN